MNPKEILENRSEGGCLKMFEKELDDEPDIGTNWDTNGNIKHSWNCVHFTIQTAANLQRKCTVLFNLAQSYFWVQIYSACYRDHVAIFLDKG